MKKPDITVLMVVHNEEKYVGQTIKSILNQTYKNFIFCIVDDGSTDNTWKVITSFRDKRIETNHFDNQAFLTTRLNQQLHNISTDFMARMDSHNIADPKRLELQRDFLLSNPDQILVGSNFKRLDERGKTIYQSGFPLTWTEIKNRIMEKNVFKHSSWFTRTNILKKEGFYNDLFRYSQDYELLLRLIPKYPVSNLPETLITEIQIPKATSQTHRFKQALFALKAQAKSLSSYPLWQSIYLFRTILYVIKSFIWQKFYATKSN